MALKATIFKAGLQIVDMWWKQGADKLERISNLTVINLPADTSQGMARLAQRNMQLQCTIHDGQISVSDKDNSVQVNLVAVKTALQRE